MDTRVPRVAIIGMGGYAARHHDAVLTLEKAGECRLVCACDPAPERFEAQVAAWRFNARAVAVYRDYREMFRRHAGELDAVVIPTPIPLHAEMHRAAVEAGLAVYLEKPPTLAPAELEEMIAVDRDAPVPTLVGFNFIAEPTRQALKRRLVAGEFGVFRSASLIGFWGRGAKYYGRAGWAGRLVGDDHRLLLDSCLGNGLSHHVHNLLHWAGVGAMESWASPLAVRSRLSRAHPIEGPDTVFLSARTDSGAVLRIALSHACRGPEMHREIVVCERAEIEYVTKREARILWRDGRVETHVLDPFDAQVENMRALLGCLGGRRRRPPTTLEDCRPFVTLHALAYVSAGRIEEFAGFDTDADGYVEVAGLLDEAKQFIAEGTWSGAEPREANTGELDQLDLVVRRMARGAFALARG